MARPGVEGAVLLSDSLTDRELEILRLVAEGLSNQEIADALYLALNTVKWYNKQLFDKLGVSSRTQAISRAQELGLLHPTSAPSQPAPPLPRHNLPAQVTSFVGRRREIATVRQLLAEFRLLTLTGPGGSGKTRLALQVAKEALPHFCDGVYFVPLAPVPAADNLLWAIAEHVDFQLHSGGEPLEQLLSYFHEKILLLVLDNFEHLTDAAGILGEILQAATGVKLLVTSRERLSVYGEACYPISGLALPEQGELEEATQSESIELFLERAQSVSPNLELRPDDVRHVIRICRLVEGMPLGVELAATWVDTLPPQEIADEIEHNLDILDAELRAAPPGQHSVRAAFDRSWNLLDEAQQAAFRRLSVFQGGFTREAAAALAGMGLRTLQALVNKSLLRRNPDTGRYEIHELLRHYAAEQLEISGEAGAVLERHAAYFADFMAERWPWMKDSRQKTALQELEADIENARAAWRYWIEQGDVSQLLKFLHSFWVIYDIRGWYPAGIDLFEQGVQVMRAAGTEEAEAGLGWLLTAQGFYSVAGADFNKPAGAAPPWIAATGFYTGGPVDDTRHGFELAKKGIQSLRRLDKHDEMMIISLISMWFVAASQAEEEDESLQAAHECLEVAAKIGDRWAIAKAQQFLAVRAIEDGEYQKAERLAHEALMAFEASGDNWSKSVVCIDVLGLHASTLGQFETARAWIHRGLKAAEEIDFKYSIQTAYWQLGYLAALEDNFPEAGKYWHKALGAAERILGGPSFIGFGGRPRGSEWGGRKLIKD